MKVTHAHIDTVYTPHGLLKGTLTSDRYDMQLVQKLGALKVKAKPWLQPIYISLSRVLCFQIDD